MERKAKAVRTDKWSKGVTMDGYHVRAGQTVWMAGSAGPPIHCERVAGVDHLGNAISAYPGTVFPNGVIDLAKVVTE